MSAVDRARFHSGPWGSDGAMDDLEIWYEKEDAGGISIDLWI